MEEIIIKMIIGVIGDRGSGKTLFMTREAFLNYCKSRYIYSNYHLKFPKVLFKNLHKPKLIDDEFLSNYRSELFNICLFLDEIYIYIDARASMTRANKIWSYFFNQTRKRGVDLYYSTQFFSQVDKRLRFNTEMFIIPKVVKKDGKQYIVINMYTRELKLIRRYMFKAETYFNMYDTNEVIDIGQQI